jgi:hypothetical protein
MNTKIGMGLSTLMLCLFMLTLVKSNPEAKLAFAEYCLYHDYPTETHIVRTKDNYNLKFFRLQGNPKM